MQNQTDVKSKFGLLIIYRYIFKTQKSHFILLSVLFLTILISIFCDCITPLIYKAIFDTALPDKNKYLLNVLIIALMSAFIFSWAFSFLQTRISAKLGSGMISLLRLKILNTVQNIDLKQVDKESILARFSEDTILLENSSINSIWIVLRYTLTAIIALFLLFYLNWRLSLVIILLIPVTLIFPRIFLQKSAKYIVDKKREEDKLLGAMAEEISMQSVIYILRLKNYRKKLFKTLLKTAAKFGDLYNTYLSYVGKSSMFGTNVVMISILAIGSYLMLHNYMDIGELIGFISLVGTIGNSVILISNQLPSLIDGSEGLKRIEHFIYGHNRLRKDFGQIILAPPKSSIIFKDVNFESNGVEIISNINVQIPVRKMVAFVGLSGSGKSTLLNLLLRHLPVSSGSILFDDVDAKKLDLNSMLSHIGLVEQHPKLFAATIKENIRLGKLNASDDEIIAAAKLAEIHEDILRFPQGYDTQISSNFQMSGGQLQRIVIARALISNPTILCLDEATSALDPITEVNLNETINKMIGQMTIISCTHRLRSIVDADHIYVLEKGHLIEDGKHQDLLKQKGLYYNLWRKQSGVELSEDMRQASVHPQWLELIPLFKGLDTSTLNSLAQQLALERKDPNQIIFSEGDFGDKFYIIVAGIVEVSHFDPQDKKQKIIATLSDGDYFGEIALLYNRRRNATITTKGVCILLTLNYQQYQNFFTQLPGETQKKIIYYADQHAIIE